MTDPAVILHLHIRPAPGKREELLAFLRRAKAYYESPGGIRMRLFEKREGEGEATSMIEVFEYATEADYESDDERVASDAKMKALLVEWRALLDGPPRVEMWRPVQV